MAASLEGGSEIPVVVDFAVVDDMQKAVIVVHGLVAARDVNDGESAVRQAHASVRENTATVGASMRHRIAHQHEFLDIHGAP